MKRVDRIVSKAQYLPCPSVVNRLMATLKDIFLLLLLTAFFLICYCTAWNWKLINSQKAKGPPKEQCSTADWGGCSTKLDLTYYLGARLELYDSRHFKKKKILTGILLNYVITHSMNITQNHHQHLLQIVGKDLIIHEIYWAGLIHLIPRRWCLGLTTVLKGASALRSFHL